jgi:probable phosphoglycerate mutase
VATTRVILVRHGQSRASVDRVAGGPRGCRGLTDTGRAQVGLLARRWAASGEVGEVSALLSSTLPRAVETAEILVPALGGLPVETDPDLMEMDPGEGDGLTYTEWGRRYGGFDLAAHPFRPLTPGGESWAGFGVRVGAVLERIVHASEGGTVVAACHGGVIEQALVQGLRLPLQGPPGDRLVTVPNASVNEWAVISTGEVLVWRLVRYGDAGHLAPAAQPD